MNHPGEQSRPSESHIPEVETLQQPTEEVKPVSGEEKRTPVPEKPKPMPAIEEVPQKTELQEKSPDQPEPKLDQDKEAEAAKLIDAQAPETLEGLSQLSEEVSGFTDPEK